MPLNARILFSTGKQLKSWENHGNLLLVTTGYERKKLKEYNYKQNSTGNKKAK